MTADFVAEELSFDAFFRANYAPLVRSLSVAVGAASAEEAVQEAFVQANLKWRQVSELQSPGAWVRRVAINRLIDQQRRDKRGEAAAGRLSATEIVDMSPADVDLADAVSSLPHKQRLAVSLYYLLDLPIDEVADLLGASPGTVKSNLHDARMRLARHLGGPDGHA